MGINVHTMGVRCSAYSVRGHAVEVTVKIGKAVRRYVGIFFALRYGGKHHLQYGLSSGGGSHGLIGGSCLGLGGCSHLDIAAARSPNFKVLSNKGISE